MPERVATHANYWAAIVAAGFGVFTVNEWAAIIGASAAVLTAVANIWFRWKHLKLAETTVRLKIEAHEEE